MDLKRKDKNETLYTITEKPTTKPVSPDACSTLLMHKIFTNCSKQTNADLQKLLTPVCVLVYERVTATSRSEQ